MTILLRHAHVAQKRLIYIMFSIVVVILTKYIYEYKANNIETIEYNVGT